MKFLDALLASLGKVGGGGRRNLKVGNDGSEASAWPNWFKFPGIGPDRLQGKVNGGRRIGKEGEDDKEEMIVEEEKEEVDEEDWKRVVVATPTVPSGDFLSVKTADQSLQPLS